MLRVANSISIVLQSFANGLYGITTLASPAMRRTVIPSSSVNQPSDTKLKFVSLAEIRCSASSHLDGSGLLLEPP